MLMDGMDDTDTSRLDGRTDAGDGDAGDAKDAGNHGAAAGGGGSGVATVPRAEVTKEKHDTICRLLEEEHVLVHLDSQVPGVVLPAHLRSNPMVLLKLSRLFRGATAVEEDRVVAELLFNGVYFTCVIPFEAVRALSGAKGTTVLWDPETGRSESVSAGPAIAPAPSAGPVPLGSAPLGSVQQGSGSPGIGTGPSGNGIAPKKKVDPAKRSHLRRVK